MVPIGNKDNMEKMGLGLVICFRPEVNETMVFYEFCSWGRCDGVGLEEKQRRDDCKKWLVKMGSVQWLVKRGLSRTPILPNVFFFCWNLPNV